jgi:hypothetical protein
MLPLSFDHSQVKYVLFYVIGLQRDVLEHGIDIAGSA